MGVASGCGCKEVYRFPHVTYIYSSCICSFLQQYHYFSFIFFYIRESCSTFYVGLVHTVPFTQYNAFVAFSPNWLPEGSTSIYTCKEKQISSPG